MEEKEKAVVEEQVETNEPVTENTKEENKTEVEERTEETTENKEETPKKEEKKGFFKKKEDAEVKKLKEENEQLKDKFLRVNAEMQNMRRRMEEEKANLLKYEGEDLIKKLLPTIDNFERAISMDDTNLEDEVSKFLSGFKMIYGNFSSTLQSYEVVAMDCLNKPFDPSKKAERLGYYSKNKICPK